MDTLAKVLEIYNIDPLLYRHMPIEIPNVGRIEGNPSLAGLFRELGFTSGVEIGTEQGKYAEELCKQNPALHLFCVDVWKTYPFYRDYDRKEARLEAYRGAWAERMKNYNATPINKYSMDAVGNFPDASLDFIYIDANHELPFVVEDIFYWSRKVRSGGIISGHDWYRTKSINSRCHVVSAVSAYTSAFWIRPWFVLGAKAMPPGVIRDHSRSWMWVKDERQP